MRRKIKKRKIANRTLIYITTIVVMNLMGISYAAWSEGSRIDFSISTGDIDPYFISMEISENEESGTIINQSMGVDGSIVTNERSYEISDRLSIDIKSEIRGLIAGSVIDSDMHTIVVKVGNNGSIPIELEGVENGEWSESSVPIIIEPNDQEEVQIHNVEISPGTDNEDIILKFKQSI